MCDIRVAIAYGILYFAFRIVSIKYTSAKFGAFRAPYFFLLGCVKRRSYMLIHVERTTAP